VGFKSEFLALVATKEQSNSQLLMAEEALAATRKDQGHLEKSNTWLSGAHAQERAMRQSLEKQVEGLRAELDNESREHSQLLTRYLSEVENRTQAQVKGAYSTAIGDDFL
jgi:chromosome segregation ATPase